MVKESAGTPTPEEVLTPEQKAAEEVARVKYLETTPYFNAIRNRYILEVLNVHREKRAAFNEARKNFVLTLESWLARGRDDHGPLDIDKVQALELLVDDISRCESSEIIDLTIETKKQSLTDALRHAQGEDFVSLLKDLLPSYQKYEQLIAPTAREEADDVYIYTEERSAGAAVQAIKEEFEKTKDPRIALIENALFTTTEGKFYTEADFTKGKELRLWVGTSTDGTALFPASVVMRAGVRSRTKHRVDTTFICPDLENVRLSDRSARFLSFTIQDVKKEGKKGEETYTIDVRFSRSIFKAGDSLRPVHFEASPLGGRYLLGDGSIVTVTLDQMRNINPKTGHNLAFDGKDSGKFPVLTLEAFDRSKAGFSAKVFTPEQTQMHETLETVMYQYLIRSDVATGWDGGRLKDMTDRELDDRRADMRILAQRLGVTLSGDLGMDALGRIFSPRDAAAIVQAIRRSTQKEPLPVVVSARLGDMSRGFTALITEWQPKRNDALATHIKRAARGASAALRTLVEQRYSTLPEGSEQRARATKDFAEAQHAYADFFKLLSEYAAQTGEDLRYQFFKSDLDGEMSVRIMQDAGLRTRVIPFVKSQQFEGVEYIPHATQADIDHNNGMKFPLVAFESGSEHERYAVVIDEDAKDIKSAASAMRHFMEQMGMLKHTQEIQDITDFIDAYDNFLGPYESMEGRRAIFMNSYRPDEKDASKVHMNIYGVLDLLVKDGRINFLRDFLKYARTKIKGDIAAGLVDFDIHDYLSGQTKEVKTWFENQIAAEHKKRFYDVQQAIIGLENAGYSIRTPYGKTLFDPFGVVKADMRLAVFALGYDAYVGFSWDDTAGTRGTTVNVSGFGKILPDNFIVDNNGKLKGSLVKYGRMFVMNRTSTPLKSFEELWKAVTAGEADARITPALQKFMEVDAIVDQKERDAARRALRLELTNKYIAQAAAELHDAERVLALKRISKEHGDEMFLHVSGIEEDAVMAGEDESVPPPPDMREFTKSVEHQRLERLQGLWPETLSEPEARMIRELQGQRYVHLPNPFRDLPLREDAEHETWTRAVEVWWNKLDHDMQKRFITRAYGIEREAAEAPKTFEPMYEGFRRILARWSREDVENLYYQAKDGDVHTIPHGVDAAMWVRFVQYEWYGAMSADEHTDLEKEFNALHDLRKRRAELEREVRELQAELRGIQSEGFLKKLFKGSKREQEHIVKIRQLQTKLRKVNLELQGVSALEHLDGLIYGANTRLQTIELKERPRHGIKGWLASLFKRSTGTMRLHPRGSQSDILSALAGSQSITKAAENDPLLMAAAHAADDWDRLLPEERVRAVPVTEHTLFRETVLRERELDPALNRLHYFAAVQEEVKRMLVLITLNGQSLWEMQRQQPLKNLLAEYARALEQIKKHEGEEIANMVTFIEESTRRLEQEVYADLRKQVSGHAFNEDQRAVIKQLIEDVAGHTYHDDHPPHFLSKKEMHHHAQEFIVHTGSEDELLNALEQFVERFHPAANQKFVKAAAKNFLVTGTIEDSGHIFGDHFLNDRGRMSGRLFPGDRIVAVEDYTKETIRFKVQIIRAPAPERKGYFDYDTAGNPTHYYDFAKPGEVRVWRIMGEGKERLMGTYKDNRFEMYKPLAWEYRTETGSLRLVSDNDKNVFFMPDGVVVRVEGYARGKFSFERIGYLTHPFFGKDSNEKLKVRQGETVREFNPHRGHYLISPRGEVLISDDLLGLRVIGEIAEGPATTYKKKEFGEAPQYTLVPPDPTLPRNPTEILNRPSPKNVWSGRYESWLDKQQHEEESEPAPAPEQPPKKKK